MGHITCKSMGRLFGVVRRCRCLSPGCHHIMTSPIRVLLFQELVVVSVVAVIIFRRHQSVCCCFRNLSLSQSAIIL